MDLIAPLSSICPHTHGRVLSVLADAERPLSGNEVARRAGLSPGSSVASTLPANSLWPGSNNSSRRPGRAAPPGRRSERP